MLNFSNLSVRVKCGKDQTDKVILDNVSGSFGNNELIGVIGSSGGGKTTLLSILSGRLHRISSLSTRNYQVEGSVECNNNIFNVSNKSELSELINETSFVLQNDIQEPLLTCRETIEFASDLSIDWSKLHVDGTNTRQNNQLVRVVKQNLLNDILNDLELNDCQNTIVGNENRRGLSGGEKKRTSIAVNLIKEYFNSNLTSATIQDTDRTMIMLLDEPTTGLDSVNAYNLVKNMKKLMERRKQEPNGKLKTLVVMSLHAPSSEIVWLLDKVVVMSKGSIIFDGKPEQSRLVPKNMNNNDTDLLHYLTHECKLKVPQYTNPVEYFLTRNRQDPDFFIQKWKQMAHEKSQRLAPVMENEHKVNVVDHQLSMQLIQTRKMSMKNGFRGSRKYTAGLMTQFKCLLVREVTKMIRNKRASIVRVGTLTAISLMFIPLFTNLNNDCSQIHSRFGFVFLSTQAVCMLAIGVNNLEFPTSRLILQKEKTDKLYFTTVWWFVKTLVRVPELIFCALWYCLITHWACNSNATFYEQFGILALSSLAADSMGFLIGSIASSTSVAFQLTPLAIVPFILFANYLIQTQDITVYLRWISYISLWYYGNNALLITEMKNVTIESCPYGDFEISPTGEWVLQEYFGIDYRDELFYIIMNFFLFIGIRMVSLLVLIAKNGL